MNSNQRARTRRACVFLVGIGWCAGCEPRTEIQFPLPTVTKGAIIVVPCPRRSDTLELQLRVDCSVIYQQRIVVKVAASTNVLFDSNAPAAKTELPTFPGLVRVTVPHLADQRRAIEISASGLCSDNKTRAAGSAECSIERD